MHHGLGGHLFEQTPGASEGQGSLLCHSPWGYRVGDDWETEQQQHNVRQWMKNVYTHTYKYTHMYYSTFQYTVRYNSKKL